MTPEEIAAVFEVLSAWRVKGPNPSAHEEAKRKLRQDWPMMWRALDKLDQTIPR